jgi:hypothetical protein
LEKQFDLLKASWKLLKGEGKLSSYRSLALLKLETTLFPGQSATFD